MPLPQPSMTGNVSWKRVSEQTQVFRLWEQTPTEATENCICSQDQNIRPKGESHIRKIPEEPWNLGVFLSLDSEREVSEPWALCGRPQKNAYYSQMQKLNGNIWKFPFVVYGNRNVSCLHSWNLWEVLEALTPLLLHCHRIEFLHFINSGPFSNGFASKITQQLTSVWEHPAVHSPVHPGVLASWRQAV